ncbi:Ankyrin repeat-containing domain protein [Elaphomyces granulatus]
MAPAASTEDLLCLIVPQQGEGMVVKQLLDNNADVRSKDNRYRRSPLSWTAEQCHVAVVKPLLDKDADDESKAALRTAGDGCVAIVKLLLNKNADVESKDNRYARTPLMGGSETAARQSADIESKDNEYDRTPLLWAALRTAGDGREAGVKLLLDKNADIEFKDK